MRNIFAELMEGLEAMKKEREGNMKQPNEATEKAMAEAEFLLSSRKNAERLAESIQQVNEMRKKNMTQVKVKKMFDDVTLPEYATPGSACFDIRAYIRWDDGADATVFKESAKFSTGLQFEIPEKHVMLVFSRSGQGFNDDMRLANCVGVIDSDYRGELKVKLTRDNVQGTYAIKHGQKIAQGLVIPYEQVQFVLADELSSTERGDGGFGSTGV